MPIVRTLWQFLSVLNIFSFCFIPSCTAVFDPFRLDRFEPRISQILECHTGIVLDFDWNPFAENMLESASK